MTSVAVAWGGKDGFSKQAQMGFFSKDPQTDSRDGGAWAHGGPEPGPPETAGGARDDPLAWSRCRPEPLPSLTFGPWPLTSQHTAPHDRSRHPAG